MTQQTTDNREQTTEDGQKEREEIVTEISRWCEDINGKNVPNQLFCDIINKGKIIDRSPLLECSGHYEWCYLYNGRVYENWVNWGYDCLFLLNRTNNHAKHQDREGRIGETYNVDRCQAYSELIEATIPKESA